MSFVWNINEELLLLFEGEIDRVGSVWALTVLMDEERGVCEDERCASESRSDFDADERH